jgi:FMN phosphatase YigB (HAD superfamily)
MPLRAVFFDVGDTLVEGWVGRERTNEIVREVIRREFREPHWLDDFLAADFGPQQHGDHTHLDEAALRQETHRWYEEWFRNMRIGVDDIDLDRLRISATAPLDLVSKPVPGAFTAVRWCKEKGLKVALVTNTLSRGDAEVWEDWRRFGLADAIDAVASSHSVGWQKPHRAIFERALELTGVSAGDAVMVGDRMDADILGAKRLGLRAVHRRTADPDAMRDVGVTPDAVIDDLTTLPAVLTAWLEGPDAQRSSTVEGARRP